MRKCQWRVDSKPRVPWVMGSLECEDDVDRAREVVANDEALVAVRGSVVIMAEFWGQMPAQVRRCVYVHRRKVRLQEGPRRAVSREHNG